MLGVEGRLRCIDCVRATEPPCSSDNVVGYAGAESLAQALEKNATLQTLDLSSECVVLCYVFGGGMHVVYVILGCCWFVFGVEERMRGVDCVRATEPPCSSDNNMSDAGAVVIARAMEKNTTLRTLDLAGECVVLCCVCGGDLIVV